MTRSRTSGAVTAPFNRQELIDTFTIFLRGAVSDVPADGQRAWTPRPLMLTALLMAWGAEDSLEQRFVAAVQCLADLYPTRKRPGKTFTGFAGAMDQLGPRVRRHTAAHLRDQVQKAAGERWRIGQWVVVGSDGSRFEAPRTAANEQALAPGAREGAMPQAWVTTLLHLPTGLALGWRIGAGDSSERAHVRQMIRLLPQKTMLVADAGFTGYDLWKQLIDAGHGFLIRVGANVKLLRKLGYCVKEKGDDGIVYLWPDDQRRAGQPPLILRLVRVHDGRREMCLVTNVLDRAQLSDAELVQMYKLRWGVEVWFRDTKQTLGRTKLRSRTPERVKQELHWVLLAVTLLGLMGVRALGAAGEDPLRLSFAQVMHTVRGLCRRPDRRMKRGQTLAKLLSRALTDTYVRRGPKSTRPYPRKKPNDGPPGVPKVRDASRAQVQAALRLMSEKPAA
jgi:hypothetical protein